MADVSIDFQVPILTGELEYKAKTLLNAISKKLQLIFYEEEEFNLLTGKAGQLLFLSYFPGKDFSIQEAAKNLLEGIELRKDLDGSFMKGLAGIGYVLKIINDKSGLFEDDFFFDCYQHVRQFTKVDIVKGNYDFMYGYLGECYFLCEEVKNFENQELFRNVLETLRLQAIPQSKGIGWVNSWELRLLYPKQDFRTIPKHANLGMSHGLPGIIYILYKLNSKYPELGGFSLVDEALGCLIHEESIVNKASSGFYYPTYAGDLGKKFKGQLSWCYSDLSISLLFFNIGIMSRDKALIERAKKIADSCREITFENTPSMGSGLCHGASGIAYMFNKIYQFTKLERYKEASIYWYTVLFDEFVDQSGTLIQVLDFDKVIMGKKVSKDCGFLEGLAGIGLSVMSAISYEKTEWDKLLLL